ncbi:MAG: efflux RND transporter periplasmic adaptor subunit, partial [Planctomycetes bacterium]|nr:efflux RND transporter periplasmic adaptor subunit [Planctomycetota bacterium]
PDLGRRRHDDNSERPVVPARLQFSDGRDYEHEGEIDFADNTVDALTGTIQIRAKFPNPAGGLIPGLFVRVLIPQETQEVKLVPEVALQRDLAGPYLLIVNGEGVVERCDVALGERLKDLRIIDSGLDGSERVIVKGLQRARPGVNVAAQEANTAAPSAGTSEEAG